MTIQLV